MGKRRSVRRSMADLVEQTEDQPIEGGCDRCDAYSIIRFVMPGVWAMVVNHDGRCRTATALDNPGCQPPTVEAN